MLALRIEKRRERGGMKGNGRESVDTPTTQYVSPHPLFAQLSRAFVGQHAQGPASRIPLDAWFVVASLWSTSIQRTRWLGVFSSKSSLVTLPSSPAAEEPQLV